jgi:hypothetical protein
MAYTLKDDEDVKLAAITETTKELKGTKEMENDAVTERNFIQLPLPPILYPIS